MKKALSVILSVLVIFSMVGVMAFAEGANPPVKVTFYDDDGTTVIKQFYVMPEAQFNDLIPENPDKPDTETTDYTFSGWLDADGNLLHKSTIPVAPHLAEGETIEIAYTAKYEEKDTTGYQSFWNFIESIFERINLLFQYFAEIFNF